MAVALRPLVKDFERPIRQTMLSVFLATAISPFIVGISFEAAAQQAYFRGEAASDGGVIVNESALDALRGTTQPQQPLPQQPLSQQPLPGTTPQFGTQPTLLPPPNALPQSGLNGGGSAASVGAGTSANSATGLAAPPATAPQSGLAAGVAPVTSSAATTAPPPPTPVATPTPPPVATQQPSSGTSVAAAPPPAAPTPTPTPVPTPTPSVAAPSVAAPSAPEPVIPTVVTPQAPEPEAAPSAPEPVAVPTVPTPPAATDTGTSSGSSQSGITAPPPPPPPEIPSPQVTPAPSETADETGVAMTTPPAATDDTSGNRVNLDNLATVGVVDQGEGLSVLFASESKDLPPGAADRLSVLVGQMKSDDTISLTLMGYSAPIGESGSRPRRMSLFRALEVRTFFLDEGIDSRRITVNALGTNDASPDRPPNRVDIILN